MGNLTRMNKENPKYSVVLAVGDSKYKKINDMCGVYAEKELIETSTKEF